MFASNNSPAVSRILRQADLAHSSPVADSLKMKLSNEILKTRSNMIDPELDAIKEPKSTWGKVNMYATRMKKYMTDSIICKSLLAGLIVCIVLLITEPEIIMYTKKPSPKPVNSKNESKESSDDDTDSDSESGTEQEEKRNDASGSNVKGENHKESKQQKRSSKKSPSTVKGGSSPKKVRYTPGDAQCTGRGVQYRNVVLIGILAGVSAAFLF